MSRVFKGGARYPVDSAMVDRDVKDLLFLSFCSLILASVPMNRDQIQENAC